MNQGPPEPVVVQNRYAPSGSPRAAKSFRKRMGVQKEVVQVGCAEVVQAFLGHGPKSAPFSHSKTNAEFYTS